MATGESRLRQSVTALKRVTGPLPKGILVNIPEPAAGKRQRNGARLLWRHTQQELSSLVNDGTTAESV